MMLGGKTLESSTKDCSSKFRSKHSIVLVLCLLRNLLEQSLQCTMIAFEKFCSKSILDKSQF